MVRSKRAVLVIAVSCLLFIISCSAPASKRLTVRRISDRVIVISCMDVNVTAIKGDSGLVIIDTDRSPSVMRKIMNRLRKEFNADKVYRVINTHGDADHTSGNQLFPDSIIIGQENGPEYMRQNQALARILKKQPGHGKSILTAPGVTFRDSFTVDAGGVVLRLYYAGPAHTNNDIFVHIPQEKTLLVGDLFYQHGWSFEVNRLNDIPRIINLLDRFIADSGHIEYVIPGHGDEFAFKNMLEIRDMLNNEDERLRSRRSAALVLSELLEDNSAAAALAKFEEFRRKNDPNYYMLKDEFALVGRHLLWQGELDKAIAAFQVLARQYPESVIAFDDLAGTFLRRGDIDSAIANYEQSLKIYPANRKTREILKMLRKYN